MISTVNVSLNDASLAEMAIDDARNGSLDEGESVRIAAIRILRSCGMSLLQAVRAVDHVLFYGG